MSDEVKQDEKNKEEPKVETEPEQEPINTNAPVKTEETDSEYLIKVQKSDIHFELDKNKSVNDQAKELVDLAATSKAVEDEELVDDITETKKEANYGIYSGIADLIGLKKPLPNKMLKALMFILMPLLITYYTIVGFITGIINVTMDCLNAITERFATFTKSAKRVILFAALLLVLVAIFLVIKFLLNKYGIIDW